MGRSVNYPETGKFRVDRRMYLVNGSYTFTVPRGVTEILAVAIGAGGGGAWGSTSYPAQGGAGGGYAQGIIDVSPGQTIAVTVGQGGNAPQSGGGNGGTSSFGSYLTATGGNGGPYTSTTQPTAGTGSTSGVADAYTSSGGTSAQGDSYNATGGGSSGSPYGPGRDSNRPPTAPNYCASGGAGWNGDHYYEDPGSYQSVEGGQGTGGNGTFVEVAVAAGESVPANGGPGLFSENNGGRGSWQPSNSTYYRELGLAEHGTSNEWWFPWEIGGSGGGGASADNSYHRVSAGNGGCGAGGGAAVAQNVSYGYPNAGHGGFGGGGGGAWCGQSTGRATGGHGGIGGGGGGGGGSSLSRGGRGGSGAVLIYW